MSTLLCWSKQILAQAIFICLKYLIYISWSFFDSTQHSVSQLIRVCPQCAHAYFRRLEHKLKVTLGGGRPHVVM